MEKREPIEWLLASDPSIRWQTLRDLANAPDRKVERERNKVATEGWGARLLKRQAKDGTWAGGLYSPKWKSTTYTALLLRDLGLSPRNREAKIACVRIPMVELEQKNLSFRLPPMPAIELRRGRRPPRELYKLDMGPATPRSTPPSAVAPRRTTGNPLPAEATPRFG